MVVAKRSTRRFAAVCTGVFECVLQMGTAAPAMRGAGTEITLLSEPAIFCRVPKPATVEALLQRDDVVDGRCGSVNE